MWDGQLDHQIQDFFLRGYFKENVLSSDADCRHLMGTLLFNGDESETLRRPSDQFKIVLNQNFSLYFLLFTIAPHNCLSVLTHSVIPLIHFFQT